MIIIELCNNKEEALTLNLHYIVKNNDIKISNSIDKKESITKYSHVSSKYFNVI